MLGHAKEGLSPLGQRQVAALAQGLIAESYYPTAVYSSPLPRAQQTAIALVTMLAEAMGHPLLGVADCEELCEFQNGIFQGLTWAEAQQRYPDLCDRLEASPDWIPIPQAETLAEGRQRAERFIHRVIQQHQQGDRLCIVSHHWILQHCFSVLLGCDRTWGMTVEHTARFEFYLDRDRWFLESDTKQHRWNSDLWQIVRWGDRQHLAKV